MLAKKQQQRFRGSQYAAVRRSCSNAHLTCRGAAPLKKTHTLNRLLQGPAEITAVKYRPEGNRVGDVFKNIAM